MILSDRRIVLDMDRPIFTLAHALELYMHMKTVFTPEGMLLLSNMVRVSIAEATSSNGFMDNFPSLSACRVTVVQGISIILLSDSIS